jgi:hypothetical protein
MYLQFISGLNYLGPIGGGIPNGKLPGTVET